MTFSRVLLIAGLGFALVGVLPTAFADDALDARWSTRLMQQKALVERAQRQLDERSTAYAKAVAADEPSLRVAELRAARETAAAELRELEAGLPKLVAEARAAGVSDEVLVPYRYAVAPQPQEPQEPAAEGAPAARD